MKPRQWFRRRVCWCSSERSEVFDEEEIFQTLCVYIGAERWGAWASTYAVYLGDRFSSNNKVRLTECIWWLHRPAELFNAGAEWVRAAKSNSWENAKQTEEKWKRNREIAVVSLDKEIETHRRIDWARRRYPRSSSRTPPIPPLYAQTHALPRARSRQAQPHPSPAHLSQQLSQKSKGCRPPRLLQHFPDVPNAQWNVQKQQYGPSQSHQTLRHHQMEKGTSQYSQEKICESAVSTIQGRWEKWKGLTELKGQVEDVDWHRD